MIKNKKLKNHTYRIGTTIRDLACGEECYVVPVKDYEQLKSSSVNVLDDVDLKIKNRIKKQILSLKQFGRDCDCLCNSCRHSGCCDIFKHNQVLLSVLEKLGIDIEGGD